MMSIQELWYRKFIGRGCSFGGIGDCSRGKGGLGYKYPKGGYGIRGGALDDNKTVASWAPDNDIASSIETWIPESTITGFNPYAIGMNEKGKEIYNKYTKDQINQFITYRDLKRKQQEEQEEQERKQKEQEEQERKERIKKSMSIKIPKIDVKIPEPILKNITENRKTVLIKSIADYNAKIKKRTEEIIDSKYNEYVNTMKTQKKKKTVKKERWKTNNKTLIDAAVKKDNDIVLNRMNIRTIEQQLKNIDDIKLQNERRDKKIELEKEIKAITNMINKIVALNEKETKLFEKGNKAVEDIKDKTELTNKLEELYKKYKKTIDERSSIATNTDIDKLYILLKQKQNELDELLTGGPIKEAEPDYFDLQLRQELENDIQIDEEVYTELLNDTDIRPLLETPIEEYDNRLNEYNNASPYPEFSEQYLSKYINQQFNLSKIIVDGKEVRRPGTYIYDKKTKQEIPLTNSKAFEQITATPAITADIISRIDSSYDKSKIKNIRTINTELGGSIIDTDGITKSFKPDENAPFDVIAIFEYERRPVKFVIEDKFYNNISLHTSLPSKKEKYGVGSKVTYNSLMSYTNDKYDKYKTNVVIQYIEAKNNYNAYAAEGLNDEQIERDYKKVYDQYHELRNKLYDNNKLSKEYYREFNVPAIPMKMSKTNFSYPEKKLVTSGVTPEDFYKYVKTKDLSNKQKQIQVDENGTIIDILNAKGKTKYAGEKGFKEKGYDLFIGANILYCISLEDALLGVNWSDMLKNDSDLNLDPFSRFKPVPTAYGLKKGEANTDSIGLTFDVLKVIARPDKTSNTIQPQIVYTDDQPIVYTDDHPEERIGITSKSKRTNRK